MPPNLDRAFGCPTYDLFPRALFEGRTGREPLYHVAIEEMQEWTYRGEPLRPLKGFPGVVWERPRRKKAAILV